MPSSPPKVEYHYLRHPWVTERLKHGAPTTASIQSSQGDPGAAARFNSWLAVKITTGVGTMWCAYVFALIALIGLPEAISQTFVNGSIHPLSLVAWIAQTFLQLVLLSIIIVGQNIQAAAADARSVATYDDAAAVLEEAKQIQMHLQAQDDKISAILDHLETLAGRS